MKYFNSKKGQGGDKFKSISKEPKNALSLPKMIIRDLRFVIRIGYMIKTSLLDLRENLYT